MSKDIHRYSFSRLDTFKTCPRKHHYLYVEQLPEPDNEYALKGKLFHEAVEKILKGEDVEPVYKEWKDSVDTGLIRADRDQLEYSINMYFSFYYNAYQEEATLAVEQDFDKPMENDDYFVGKIDQIYDRNGLFIVRDLKTTGGPLKYTYEKVQNNMQLLTYVEPAEKLFNRTVDAVEIDEVRLEKLAESVPLIKNNKPSRDLDTLSLTTADLYREELETQNLLGDPKYQYTLSLLEQRGHPLFRRVLVQLSNRNLLDNNDEEIANLYLGAALDIKYRIKDSSKCFMCPYKQVCEHDEYGAGSSLREKLLEKNG